MIVILTVSAKVRGTDWDYTYHIPGNSAAPLVRHELSPWQPPMARQPLQTNLTAYDEDKFNIWSKFLYYTLA